MTISDLTPYIGYIAAVCTTTSFLPQAVKTLKSKRTKDISLPMYLILATGVALWGVYGILIQDIAVTLSNIFTLLFVLPILFLKLKNG